MILAVVGSTKFTNKNRVYHEINELRKVLVAIEEEDVTEIVSGGAPGADTFGKEYALEHKLTYTEFPADWTDFSEPCVRKRGSHGEYNALAGFKRNTFIAERAHVVLAFLLKGIPCNGTRDTIKKANGKRVIEIEV